MVQTPPSRIGFYEYNLVNTHTDSGHCDGAGDGRLDGGYRQPAAASGGHRRAAGLLAGPGRALADAPRPDASFLGGGLTFLLFVLILVGIPAWLGSVAVAQLIRLETDFLAAVAAIGQWLTQPVVIFGFPFHFPDLLRNLPALTGETLATLPSGSLDILSSVTTNLLWGSAVLVTLYYFLKDGPRIKPWLAELAPVNYQGEVRRLLDEVDRIWGKFLRVQLLIFLILAVLAAVGTLLVVWLFRSGLVQWSLFGFILLLLGVYTAVQQVDNLWLRPQFLGKQLRLHPGIVFVSLIGALALSGVLGALVIVPVIATGKVIGRYVHRKLLGLPPWPEKAPLTTDDDADAGT